MRNFLFALLIVIIILIVCAPALDGYLFKRHYMNLINLINEEGVVRIDVLAYEEGWLKSHATIRVIPKTFATQAKPPVIIMDNFIAHGPILRNLANTGYTFGFAAIQTLVNFSDPSGHVSNSKAEINTLTSFGGTWYNLINISQVVLTQANAGEFSWQGLRGNLDLGVSGDRINYINTRLDIGAILMEGTNTPVFQRLFIEPIAYSRNARRLRNSLWSDDTKISIPNFSANLSANKSLIFNNFNFASQMGEGSDSTAYSAHFQTTINQLTTPSGLLPSLNYVKGEVNFDNLDAQGAVNLRNEINSLHRRIEPQEALKYMSLLPKLFTPSSTMSLNLNFNTPDGPFHVDARLTWKPNALIATVNDLYQNANLFLNFRIAIPIVNKFVSDYAATSISNAPVQQLTSPAASAKDIFNQTVGTLYQQGKMSLPASIKIIELSDQRVTQEYFAANVQTLGLAPDVTQQVIQAYQQYQTQLATPTALTPEQIQAQQKALAQQTQQTMLNQMINNWLSEGYLKIDNGSYVSSIVYRDNTTTINGKVIQQLPRASIPLGPGIQLPAPMQHPQPGGPQPPEPTLPGQ